MHLLKANRASLRKLKNSKRSQKKSKDKPQLPKSNNPWTCNNSIKHTILNVA